MSAEEFDGELNGLNGEEEGDREQDELYEHHRIVADKNQSLLRVDKFLINRLQNIS